MHFSTFLSGLAVLHLSTAAPLVIPLGSTGESLTISSSGKTATLNGRTINLLAAFSPSSRENARSCDPQLPQSKVRNAKALYFLSNAASNSIISLKVDSDGRLSDGSVTPTGGVGMSGLDATGTPAGADGLFSQGAIKVEEGILVAVNPGSNTVSMFSVSAEDPTHLTLVGKPVSSGGEFPVSVSISTKLSIACVANSGAVAGISCFEISPKGLVPMDKAIRPFQLNQTTPPAGPLNTVSQTFFNADSTVLLTTVKGDPTKNNAGFLSAFPVVNGSVSTEEIRSSPEGTAVLFGSTTLPSTSDIFVTDASFGTATLSVASNLTGSTSVKTPLSGQKATCWAAFSTLTGTAFVTDVALNRLSEIDTKTGAIVSQVNSTNGNLGMIDLATKGNFVYALAPGNATQAAHVAVFDVSGGRGTVKEVQNFKVNSGSDTVQGMALC